LVTRQVGVANMHCGTKFIRIGQTVAEISHFTTFKMAAVCHLGFLKIFFCEQLVSSGGLLSVIVQNSSKIGQTVLEIL